GMTIRILDDATYNESLVFDNPERHSGVVLEGVGKRKPRIGTFEQPQPGNQHAIWVRDVPNVTLRGLHIMSGSTAPDVFITGRCHGVVLDGLELEARDDKCVGVELNYVTLKDGDEP